MQCQPFQGYGNVTNQDYSRWRIAVHAIVVDKKQAVTQVTKGSNRWRRHFLTQSEEAQDSEKDNNKTHPPDYVVHACLLKLFIFKRWGVVSPIIHVVACDFILPLIEFYFSSPSHI
ncbi:hypothetical protein SAMN05216417_1024 [Nitrosospira multiformis]|uniref:Uncharacterized protein n=1 Tax=Nitrosospira multiformis TaxID=1231 RepID=A0A1I7FM28_9PROT|nr:hypothetical protein SAMN05216417_1024 [Nitrosospira multiformis]